MTDAIDPACLCRRRARRDGHGPGDYWSIESPHEDRRHRLRVPCRRRHRRHLPPLRYERLGLKLSPALEGRRTLLVGGPANLFAVHFLAAAPSDDPLTRPLRDAATWPLLAVALPVADLDAALGELEAKGVRAARFRAGGEGLAWLPLHEKAGPARISHSCG